jgi:SAM-dependent methyltransferase
MQERTDAAPLLSSTWRRRRLVRLKRRTKEILGPDERRYSRVRRRLANAYLSGNGLEIGALYLPLKLPAGASVRYVDRCDVAELRVQYPELDDYELVRPDIIDDGEILSSISDESVDFVIANHMLEHCEDPIRALSNLVRTVRPGGSLFLAVPDKRFTFDRDRRTTELAHLVGDYQHGPESSRARHYDEWAELFPGNNGATPAERARSLEAERYSIHFHTWTPTGFLELIGYCRGELALPVEVDALERNSHEFIVVLARTG